MTFGMSLAESVCRYLKGEGIMKNTQAMGKTSETVRERAIYAADCCNVEVLFDKGKTFQRCPECEALTRWHLVILHQEKAS
jgi:hypothetical protein